MSWLTISLLFPVITIAALLGFLYYYWKTMRPREGTLEWIEMEPRPKLRRPRRLYPMERRDALPLLLLTVVYAFTAFYKLGDVRAPESFYQFHSAGESVVLVLDEPREIGALRYYTGLWTGNYKLEYSTDGAAWKQAGVLKQEYDDLFKWLDADLSGLPSDAQVKALRITADSGPMELGELACYDAFGTLLTKSSFTAGPSDSGALLDEPQTVPAAPDYLNSTYFDEIYHARTAYEHIRHVYPYEITHPPLGKLIIGLGIRLFGMTPFGWRFMGTLFGVGMLPLLYCFLKNMFGKTPIAFCGTALFAFDFMHLTQTRIATIDTYGVFFVLAMYYFMYRFISQPEYKTFRETVPWLVLSGLSFGLGAASKWTVLYGGAGLAVLFFIFLYSWRKQALEFRGKESVRRQLIKTLLFAVLCFILIPGIIYCFAYAPYAVAKGQPLTLKLIWENQVYMLNYHKGVTASHPYASKWWQWILDIRPILYYLDNNVNGLKSAFGAFSNPVVCWGGLGAMAMLVWRFIKTRSPRALFIMVGYLSQLLFWIPISRPTFAYHYFPSILFLVFALTYLLNDIWDRKPQGCKAAVYSLTGGAVLLYVAFYPVLTGIPVAAWYSTNFLRWLPSWPF